MKKHLALVVGGYYPNPSPTGKCAEAYVDLLREQYDISVICIAGRSCEPFSYHNKQVYPTADVYTLFQHWLEQKKAPRLIRNAAKVPVHLFQCFVHPNNLYGYIKKARAQLEAVHALRPVDVIFSVGAPMAAHVAARDFRRTHPDIRWVSYTVDSYAAQNKGSCRHAGALAFETAVLSACDRVLLSEEIYESSPMLYQNFSQKCEALPYLMPPATTVDITERRFDPGKTNLVYAGRFYKDIRNPEYLLRLMLEMDGDCVLHLFCQSDCDSLIDEYVRRSKGRMVRHAPVSAEEIQKVYAEADILVSVGNNTPEFMPSKTFEYIASGKPIINIFYAGLRDEVLDKSPLTLQLQRNMNLQEACSCMHQFIQTNHGRILSRDEIEKQYYKHGRDNIRYILLTAMCSK